MIRLKRWTGDPKVARRARNLCRERTEQRVFVDDVAPLVGIRPRDWFRIEECALEPVDEAGWASLENALNTFLMDRS